MDRPRSPQFLRGGRARAQADQPFRRVQLIDPTLGWFDVAHYLSQLEPDHQSGSPWLKPLLQLHYLLEGWRRGCSHHPRQRVLARFNVEHYLQQLKRGQSSTSPLLKRLLQLHYLLEGWRGGLSPHPLFDPCHYRARCLALGLPLPREPLAHFLQRGLDLGITPSPLIDHGWPRHGLSAMGHNGPPSLDQLHPLGRAALLICDHAPGAARERLRQWLEQGIPASDRQQLQALAASQPVSAPEGRILASPGHIQVHGVSLCHWVSHAWLQRLPLGLSPQELQEAMLRPAQPGQPIHVLHLPLDEAWWAPDHLSHLRRVDCVWDPCLERVQVLNLLGVAAFPLMAEQPANGWLSDFSQDPSHLELGLPDPDHLPAPATLLLGSIGADWDGALPSDLLAVPAFEAMAEVRCTPAQARALAAWLQDCQQRGLQLVRLQPSAQERIHQPFLALDSPLHRDPAWLPCQFFDQPLSVAVLQDELHWRRQGCSMPIARIETPAPSTLLLFEQTGADKPSAAVCISLYNYAERVITALESVYRQSHVDLELIVVDDASEDDGAARVQAWMANHAGRFARSILLQHQRNGGLASARNTAFAAASAPWCFVLDADNTLEPEAVSACLSVASMAEPQVAVVHPLIRDCPSVTALAPVGLIAALPWQQDRFLSGNYVDAMAFVRQSAWQAVGGYAHIPGGWEDYDFWCSLIDAGFTGLLCPRVLACYNRHAASMQANSTQPQLRRISRLLQARHPWLRLPLAARDV